MQFLLSLPKELAVAIASFLPIIEVRGAIPLGVYLKVPAIPLLLIAIISSVIPVYLILLFLEWGTKFLRRFKYWDNFFEWLFSRTRAKSKIIKDLELIGLIIFIAIPLPGTGVWTGTIAAWLLRFKWWQTFICALLGTTIASIIILLVSQKVGGLF